MPYRGCLLQMFAAPEQMRRPVAKRCRRTPDPVTGLRPCPLEMPRHAASRDIFMPASTYGRRRYPSGLAGTPTTAGPSGDSTDFTPPARLSPSIPQTGANVTQTSASLEELVATLNDGVAFYEHAARKVTDAGFVDLFERMARLKQAIAGDFNVEISLLGERPREQGSMFGAIRIAYAEVLGALTDQNAATYVARLEEQEDRLLAAFRDAVLGGESSRARDLALRYYPEIEQMHAEMSRLKKHLA